ncbi:MAG TPA: hypothetical protein VNO70_16595 [Blastocatellia bacterium]|nr:hypothetical protein [Blastocatellia bacterium]
MKVCPVCSEVFENDFKFCELDGARLKSDGASPRGTKLWSSLGVALLLGAVIVTAASIIFFPRSPVSSTPAGAVASSATSAAQPAVAQPAGAEAAPASDAPYPEIVVEEPPLAEVKKKEKPSLAEEEKNTPIPDPKAAAMGDSDKETDPKAATVPEVKPPEPTPTVKAVNTRETEEKPAQPEADKEKEEKSAAAKNSKETGVKKETEEKEKKKKGGLFGVFKKIFGGGDKDKDDKDSKATKEKKP